VTSHKGIPRGHGDRIGLAQTLIQLGQATNHLADNHASLSLGDPLAGIALAIPWHVLPSILAYTEPAILIDAECRSVASGGLRPIQCTVNGSVLPRAPST